MATAISAHLRRRSIPPPEMENNLPIPNLSDLVPKLLSIQAQIIHNCLLALSSPFFSIFARAQQTREKVDSATVERGSHVLLRKLGFGFLGAAYACMVLTAVMVFASVLGVGLVRFWMEEPVFVRERLYFDYADVRPNAVFSFDGGGGTGFREYGKNNKMGVPVGHTFYISLSLLMPESDFNRNIGMFQLTAELISTNGNVLSRSSHPCMLRFRSFPIRLMRTFLMGLPLLVGITTETQRITVPMLSHKERNPRTEAVRITLISRAGTSFLPQLYEAEIIINSKLPWWKGVVHNWKWTLYVWTSLYIYIMLLIIILCIFRPLVFLSMTSTSYREYDGGQDTSEMTHISRGERSGEVSETLRRWQQSRSRRKALMVSLAETVGSCASSMSVTRDDATSATADDDAGDSESVCFRG